jgi:hypothetical protein
MEAGVVGMGALPALRTASGRKARGGNGIEQVQSKAKVDRARRGVVRQPQPQGVGRAASTTSHGWRMAKPWMGRT